MKIVFLDRDGVINKFPGNGNYVTKLSDFQFIPGALKALRDLTKAGYTIFVISNQAGVGKGLYSEEKLFQITEKMLLGVKRAKAKISGVFYCTHRSDQGCDCRKPGIGSVRRALLSINKNINAAKGAFFVGDTQSDIQAGHKAGCKTIFVLSGREDETYLRRKWQFMPDYIAENLSEAVKIILAKDKKVNVKSEKTKEISAPATFFNPKLKLAWGKSR